MMSNLLKDTRVILLIVLLMPLVAAAAGTDPFKSPEQTGAPRPSGAPRAYAEAYYKYRGTDAVEFWVRYQKLCRTKGIDGSSFLSRGAAIKNFNARSKFEFNLLKKLVREYRQGTSS